MNKTGKTVNQLGFSPGVSPFSKESLEKYFEVSKKNRELLSSCKFHEFTIELNKFPERKSNSNTNLRYECKNCGGEVSPEEAKWYSIGVEHGVEKCKEESL